MLHKRYQHSGFTLVELIISIAIVAVLSAVVVVVMNPDRRFKSARDSNTREAMLKYAEAVELCYLKEQTKASPGDYLDCDQISELVAGGFLRDNFEFPPLVGYSTAWWEISCFTADDISPVPVGTDFCIRFYLEETSVYVAYFSSMGRLVDGYISDAGVSCTNANMGTYNYRCE